MNVNDSIIHSVGEGGANQKKDVAIVQLLLNRVRSRMIVPSDRLVVDGIVGPRTINAIREFQQQFTSVVDGRVDPHAETITKLNQLAPPLPPLNDGVAFLEPNVPPRGIA
jgi:peptidoglycan hydrolase-like protein with peptidoglycan-binding domain